MIHRKLTGLMSDDEVLSRTASRAMETAESAKTSPSGSISVTNSDGTRTVLGAVNSSGSTMATHVGDTTPPGVPTGITAWSGDGTVHVAWDGTLTGGIPADFDHVTLLVDGAEFAQLTSAGSATCRAVTVGSTVSVTATAEDDVCAIDGTAAHNVSAACAAVSVVVTDTAATTDQHFWADADGAHVSSTGDHDLSGLNLLLTSAKLAFRKALAELLTIDAVNGVISFLGGAVTIRGVEWHRGGTDYEGVGMHSTQDGVEMSCDSSWEGEPARVAVGSTGPSGETGGCVYLEGQRIFAKDPSLASDGANAHMSALWALLVGMDTHVVAGESAATLGSRLATLLSDTGWTWIASYGGGDGIRWRCVGGTVYVQAAIYGEKTVGSGGWDAGVIPAAYRPSSDVAVAGVSFGSLSNPTQLRARANGKISLWAPSDTPYFGGSLSYPIG